METETRLARKLGVREAVFIGLGSMIGAGIFTALNPAAEAAGEGLLMGLGLAGIVAFCNASSSAQLARLYPKSGGTYVYATRQINSFSGWIAGWAFIVGKLASCAAAALTFGYYVRQDQAHLLAMLTVIALTAITYHSITKTAMATTVMVLIVLGALGAVVVTALAGERRAELGPLTTEHGWYGVLQSGGILFFAFAGYARIGTLGEEVREPKRSIPLAIMIAFGITFAVYFAIAISGLLVIGAEGLAATNAPLVEVVKEAGGSGVAPLVRIGAAVAALGVLLSLIAGISRTTFAMASDGRLPGRLAAVHPRHKVPHVAALAIGAILLVVVSFADLRGAIGFSAFTVLLYYAITNASAFTLERERRFYPRAFPILGFIGCVVLAFTLPTQSLIVGGGVMSAGALVYALQRRTPANQAGNVHN